MGRNRDEVVEYLLGRCNYEKVPFPQYTEQRMPLARMRELLARLGNPQVGLPVVHVAGTKGKGSTAAMLAAVLKEAGYRTGLYISPAMDRLEERICLDGQPMGELELVELMAEVRPVVEQIDAECPAGAGPTFFEILTALAFLYYQRQGVDLAVMEVGLGGRLDSTNVCHPVLCIITSISLDHQQQLGHTLSAIAAEKAGIIKPGVPIISGVTEAEPAQTIAQIAAQHGSPLKTRPADFDYQYTPPRNMAEIEAGPLCNLHCHTSQGTLHLSDVRLRLLGRHQAANASLVLAGVAELNLQGWHIPENAVRAGLWQVCWPVVVDSAHNPASAEVLLAALCESFPAVHRVLVFAASRDKDYAGMLALLAPHFHHLILTRHANAPRSATPADLLASLPPDAPPATLLPSPAALPALLSTLTTPSSLVVITGSVFLAAETRHLFLPSLCTA